MSKHEEREPATAPTRDQRGRGRSAGCRGRRPSPRRAARRRSASRAARSATALARKAPTQRAARSASRPAPSGRRPRRPRPRRGRRASDVDGAAGARRAAGRADDDRDAAAGRPGRGRSAVLPRRSASTRTQDAEHRRGSSRRTPQLGAALIPSALGRSASAGWLMPGPARQDVRDRACPARRGTSPNSSPVRNASVQPCLVSVLLPLRRVVHLRSARRSSFALSVGADPGRRHDAAPVGEHQVDPGLLQRRRVCSASTGSRWSPRGPAPDRLCDLVQELAEAGGAEGDLARRGWRPAARRRRRTRRS